MYFSWSIYFKLNASFKCKYKWSTCNCILEMTLINWLSLWARSYIAETHMHLISWSCSIFAITLLYWPQSYCTVSCLYFTLWVSTRAQPWFTSHWCISWCLYALCSGSTTHEHSVVRIVFPLSAKRGMFIEQQQPIKDATAINKTPAASKTPTLVPW